LGAVPEAVEVVESLTEDVVLGLGPHQAGAAACCWKDWGSCSPVWFSMLELDAQNNLG